MAIEQVPDPTLGKLVVSCQIGEIPQFAIFAMLTIAKLLFLWSIGVFSPVMLSVSAIACVNVEGHCYQPLPLLYSRINAPHKIRHPLNIGPHWRY